MLLIQVFFYFFYEWFEEYYIMLLKKVVKKEFGFEGQLEYSIVMENNFFNIIFYMVKFFVLNSKVVKNVLVIMLFNILENLIKNLFIILGFKKVNVDFNLNFVYFFENFVEGDCN